VYVSCKRIPSMSGLKATPMTCYGSKLTKQSKYSVLPCSGPKIRSLHLIESSALILTFASTPYSQAFLSRARTWIELSVVQMFLIIAHCLSSLVCVTTPAHPPVRPFLFVIAHCLKAALSKGTSFGSGGGLTLGALFFFFLLASVAF